MTDNDRWRRLRQLSVMPSQAAIDHRHFLDADGNDIRLKNLSRNERRRLNSDAKRLSRKYIDLIVGQYKSGAGYPIDQIIRHFSIEYNHRYASAGTGSQPVSFNYIEPFLSLHYFENSYAPYLKIDPELDHLFFLNDFLDFVTDEPSADNNIQQLYSNIPDGRIFNYTSNGIIEDNIYTTTDGAEFVFSGFSFVRHGNYVNWCLIGGETLPEDEWIELGKEDFTLSALPPYKRKFLEKAIELNGSTSGLPLPLEGTERAIRKVLAGEFDLISERHLTRCLMTEFENAFLIHSDDPDVVSSIRSEKERNAILDKAKGALARASALWGLASALLCLPHYFDHKLNLVENVRAPRQPAGLKTNQKSGNIRYVSSLAPASTPKSNTILSYAPREFMLESTGWWKTLSRGSIGRGPHGEPVPNRTWIEATVEWRDNPQTPRTIYVKSTLSEAKLKAAALEAAATDSKSRATTPVNADPCLYVLRCAVMETNVFKIGWTTGTAEDRAKELSSTTGVPLAFIVVRDHHHAQARELEAGIHAALAPYRINTGREFFRVDIASIDSAISSEIKRLDRK